VTAADCTVPCDAIYAFVARNHALNTLPIGVSKVVFTRGLGGRVTFLGFGNVYLTETEKERADFGGFFAQLAWRVHPIKSWRDFQNRREVT
jgi:hypothetical protein